MRRSSMDLIGRSRKDGDGGSSLDGRKYINKHLFHFFLLIPHSATFLLICISVDSICIIFLICSHILKR